MTLVSIIPLILFAIAFSALVVRFALPGVALSAAGDLAVPQDAPFEATPAASRFGGDLDGETREPAVAAFPRAM